ncbi:MAG TPA: FecR domain-containing protein [Burkholderiales bacterium]
MKKTIFLAGMACGVFGAGYAQAQSAGVVQFAAGDVKVVAASGVERIARKGVPVSVGDTLLTAPGALAQLKMGDGAIVVVQPQSRLTVAEFHYAGQEDGTEKVRYKLEQGGFRAVTGAIGRTHKQNYLIETPIAHMGVRGTDHESYYFPATGPVAGDGAKPGAYNKVNTGRTFIRTGAGEVEIDPNQVGYVASANQVPVILPGVPGFFNQSIAPRSARPSVSPAPDAAQFVKVEQSVETDDGDKLVRPRGQRAPIGNAQGPLLGYAIAKGSAGFARSVNGVQVAASNGAAFTQVGEDTSVGVRWGTWGGGTMNVGGEIVVAPALVHQIDSSIKTLPNKLGELAAAGVSGTYSYAPGNGMVANLQGRPGTIQKLEVGVDFGKQMINSYVLEAKVIGDWKANGSGSFAQFTGGSGIQLTGSCTGCPGTGSPAASGTAHGAFVGTDAQGMITSFGLTSAGQAISGAANLKR